MQALAAALPQAPAPYLFNADQGSQFTCPAFEQALRAAGGRISRDGRGRATDNTFIERRWRTVKWEPLYLNPAHDGHHLHQPLPAYFAYYQPPPSPSKPGWANACPPLPNQPTSYHSPIAYQTLLA